MKRVIDTSESLGIVQTPEGACEVCAVAEAAYEETEGRLIVKLDAFLRTTDLRTKERHIPAAWLPKPETVRESVGPEETVDLARDVFHRWVRKVREATPSLSHH